MWARQNGALKQLLGGVLDRDLFTVAWSRGSASLSSI
jgi:hypothetical protein